MNLSESGICALCESVKDISLLGLKGCLFERAFAHHVESFLQNSGRLSVRIPYHMHILVRNKIFVVQTKCRNRRRVQIDYMKASPVKKRRRRGKKLVNIAQVG